MNPQGNPNVPLHQIPDPTIDPGILNPRNVPVDVGHHPVPRVFLKCRQDATQVYVNTGRNPRPLDHHAPGWGQLHYCYMLPLERATGVFRVPASGRVPYVVIKQINIQVAQRYLAAGGLENPWREAGISEAIGDDIHVIKVIETLEAEGFLFVVYPMARETLTERIPWFQAQTLDTAEVRAIITQIFRILEFLRDHAYCHRDLKPDNLVFLPSGNLVAIDLALAIRIPQDPQGNRVDSHPQGRVGTRPWMASEILNNRTFDCCQIDCWSVGIILYNLLTGKILHRLPHPVDRFYLYFIMMEGLQVNNINQNGVQVMLNIPLDTAINISQRITEHRRIDDAAIELLENLLKPNRADRWSLDDALNSTFLT